MLCVRQIANADRGDRTFHPSSAIFCYELQVITASHKKAIALHRHLGSAIATMNQLLIYRAVNPVFMHLSEDFYKT